jgi:hypothetical protein
LLVIPLEAVMRDPDRGPETFEVIEEVEFVIVETPADGVAGTRGAEGKDDPLIDVDPGDEDGLPDGPAKYRVPS